jgi:uncharacterized protein YjbI with pentapeptide repeats
VNGLTQTIPVMPFAKSAAQKITTEVAMFKKAPQPLAGVDAPRLTQEQLARFITHHEHYVFRRPQARRFIMRFVQLHGLSLAGRDLTEAELTGACLHGCDLTATNFTRAGLHCADLRSADATGANFTRADLRGVTLRGARLNGAVLDEADLRSAVVAIASEAKGLVTLRHSRDPFDNTGAAIGEDGETAHFAVDFSDASLVGARLDGASLKHANFSGAILTGAQIKGARLDGANFEGAVLTGVDVVRAGLSPQQLRNCVLDPSPAARSRAGVIDQKLETAERWWRTGGKEGEPARLDKEDLRVVAGAFAKRQLTGLCARGANGIGVNFSGSQLQGASFEGADLRGADFSGADVRGANFNGANLTHAKFADADLSPLPITKDLSRATTFKGARGAPLIRLLP